MRESPFTLLRDLQTPLHRERGQSALGLLGYATREVPRSESLVGDTHVLLER